MNVDPMLLKKELMYLILYLVISIPVLVLYLRLSKKARKEWLALMGELKPKETYEWERRRYIRLNTVFPVEFQKIDGERLGSLHEGFTRDISRSGICVEVKALHKKRLEALVPNRTRLKLIINMPLFAQPIEAEGMIRWVQKVEGPAVDRYAIGVYYDNISHKNASRIIKYALWVYRKPVFLASIMLLLVLTIASLFIFLSDLRTAGLQLQQKMEEVTQERKILVDRIKKADLERTELDRELQNILESKRNLKRDISAVEKKERTSPVEKNQRSSELKLELERALEQEEALQGRIDELEETAMKVGVSVEEPEAVGEAEPEATKAPLITDKIIADEAVIYKTFRDYILKENIQLLDRFCYQNRSSIYHAASLFALAELHYKHSRDWVTVENSYKEVIRRYPRSRYASYASHRLEQLERRLPYEAYTLRYFYITYGLPIMLDYREIQPHKE